MRKDFRERRAWYANNSGHLIFSENISILIDLRCSGIALLDTLHLETFFCVYSLANKPKKRRHLLALKTSQAV
jgi:hypothetical protein